MPLIIFRRRRLWGAALCAMAAAQWPQAAAQTAAFPSKPIRMIVSVGAGGATDSAARRLAERLSKSLGQPVLVENQPAASGVIAAQTVARAPADGHTLLIGTNTTHAGNASLIKNLAYDPINDFEPVALLATAALVLCINDQVPAKTLPEFMRYAKANPGKVAFGAGTGSARLASELLKAKGGVNLMSVPYKSNAQALQDLRGGQIQMLFGDITLMLPQIRSNAVKALGVSTLQRSVTMPDMPTLHEQGIAGFELAGFIAAFAPAKTPEPIVRRLNEEITKILRDKEFADALAASGMDAAPTTPQQLREFVMKETRKWADLAQGAGIQPE